MATTTSPTAAAVAPATPTRMLCLIFCDHWLHTGRSARVDTKERGHSQTTRTVTTPSKGSQSLFACVCDLPRDLDKGSSQQHKPANRSKLVESDNEMDTTPETDNDNTEEYDASKHYGMQRTLSIELLLTILP